MLRFIFLVSTILSACDADYTIRTRQNDSRVILDESSPMVVSTIAVPPYLSTFHNGSQGLVPDLLKVIQEKNGLPKDIDLRVTKEATPGMIGGDKWSGIVEDAKFQYTHFAVGPIYDNMYLTAEEDLYFSVSWYKPQINLIVRSDSEMAKKQTDRQPNQYIDFSKVKLIVVDNSAEYQLLQDHRFPLFEVEVLRTELRNGEVKIVGNICDGLRELGVIDLKDEPFKGKITSNITKALIANSLEADHFASGNEFSRIISPFNNGNIAQFAFMTNLKFRKLASTVNDAIGKKNTQNEINRIVRKWSEYDREACKKLKSSLIIKSGCGSLFGHFHVVVMLIIGAVVVVVDLN